MGNSLTVRDLNALVSWHADWRDVRVVVLGLGVTGFSAADTLTELGASVLVVASKASDERAAMLEAIGATLELQPDASVVPPTVDAFDPELVIVSPGYPLDHSLLVWAVERNVPVWGDIELAWRVRDKLGDPADWIVVTGTNGKTTTVQLVAHLLGSAGLRAAAVGNIGVPVLDAIRYPAGFDVFVVELSSFQLHWMPRTGPGAIAPAASACLNIADDHLDFHGSRDAYIEAKGTVFWNTRLACVYNRADEVTMHLVEEAEVQEGCRAIGFGLDTPGPSDLGMVGDLIVDRAFLDDRHKAALELTTHGELSAAGLASPHTVANVLAAAALVRAVGMTAESVRTGLATFRIDHHRTETVATHGGIVWVDDSKATNPHAADAALRSFPSVVWIVGGLLKGVDIGPLVERHRGRLRGAVIIGVNRQPVVEAFERHAPDVPLIHVEATDTDGVMPHAVRIAGGMASQGDTVLMAPAAASMDQFIDYADRGDRFAAAVRSYLGGAGDDDDARPAGPDAGSS
ncbi:MAG: UDP-N-acetylmuramoyl-L-alanine--D-glutamate ligase [Salinibacterium sp.]|nr:UDP-N-acetylmuramoyl-L-alanine--D-glutamate ligase [Salinibacterium sp.]